VGSHLLRDPAIRENGMQGTSNFCAPFFPCLDYLVRRTGTNSEKGPWYIRDLLSVYKALGSLQRGYVLYVVCCTALEEGGGRKPLSTIGPFLPLHCTETQI
ncbi:unnamed protein product, partial [Laminaria digitata]